MVVLRFLKYMFIFISPWLRVDEMSCGFIKTLLCDSESCRVKVYIYDEGRHATGRDVLYWQRWFRDDLSFLTRLVTVLSLALRNRRCAVFPAKQLDRDLIVK